jgi:hypothetical protein
VNRHVDLVGLLHVLWGGLGVLLGVALVILAAGALAIAKMPEHKASAVAAGLTAIALGGVGVVLAAGGALSAWIGTGLRRHRAPARVAAFALALLNLFILPFGTALGIYTFWTLAHHDARELFEPAAPREL